MTTTGSQPPSSWRDDFSAMQQPRPRPVDDLSRFVLDRIDAAERAPSYEFPAAYDKPAGPIAHRYAAEMRRDMIAFRKIIARYCDWSHERDEARAANAGDLWTAHNDGLRIAVMAIATRFADHPDFSEEWRLE